MRSKFYLSLTALLLAILIMAPKASAIRYKKHSSHAFDSPAAIELRLGYWDRSKDENYIYQPRLFTTDFNEYKGTATFINWLDENAAVTFSIGVARIESEHEGSRFGYTDENSGVVSFMAGMRYYFPQGRQSLGWRPYLAVAGGPVLGVYEYTESYDEYYHEELTTATFGLHVGGGVDFFLGPNATVGFNAGYNAYGDFSTPISGQKNHSGAEIGISFGFIFGH